MLRRNDRARFRANRQGTPRPLRYSGLIDMPAASPLPAQVLPRPATEPVRPQPEVEVATRGVADHDGRNPEVAACQIDSFEHILERARPSASRLCHAPVFKIRSCKT